jgi:Sortase domain
MCLGYLLNCVLKFVSFVLSGLHCTVNQAYTRRIVNYLQKYITPLTKQLVTAAFFLIVSLILGVFARQELHSDVPIGNDVSITNYTEVAGPLLPKSLPTVLRIPALDLQVDFTSPLRLADNGEVAVPEVYDRVGWYEYGPTPGELGPAVILGHVDSYEGPAVFFSLGQLKVGDSIYISREDGQEAKFEVALLERYAQNAFPAAKVYGDIDHAGLRLITCSGIFDRGTKRYTHNLVVYARLVE